MKQMHRLPNGSWITLESVTRIAMRPAHRPFPGMEEIPASMNVGVDASDQNRGEQCIAKNNEQAQQWCDELAALVNETRA